MADEDDPEHVVNLPFQPVRVPEETCERIYERRIGWKPGFDPDPAAGVQGI